MAPDVIEIISEGDLRLRLKFENGLIATVDFAHHLKGKTGLCAEIQNPNYFKQVKIDSDLHTIVWPNGYDIDPEVLYSWASGKPIGFAASAGGR